MSKLAIETLPLGPIQANCHLLMATDRKEAVIVDPGGEVHRIAAVLEAHHVRPIAIWNTHGHIDHVGGNHELKQQFNIPISIHEIEKDWVNSSTLCGADWLGIPFQPQPADHLWKDRDAFAALGLPWRILHVPGHSPGSVLIVSDEARLVIGGDLIFRDSIGRTDLPFGDPRAMADSLRRAMELPDDYRILTGHGPDTTIGRERRGNFILRHAMRQEAST